MIEEMLCCDATDKEIYDEVGTIMGTVCGIYLYLCMLHGKGTIKIT